MKSYHYKPTEKTLIAVYALHKLGWSTREISRLFDVHKDTIRYWLPKGYEVLQSYDFAKTYKGERPKIIYCDPHKLENYASDTHYRRRQTRTR